MKRKVLALAVAVFLMVPFYVNAGPPLETVKSQINRILDVLRDPALKGEAGKKVKRDKIRGVSENMFDYAELSRRTLGQNWSKLNAGQQKEFVDLYKRLLEDAYADKIITYTDEKVVFSKDSALTEKTAEVQTTVATKKADIPIHYRLILKGSEWKVYDVVIEGVSLVSNYRNQFSEILSSKSPDGLIDTLRKKVARA
ncbi:MAG TPA: ABC transporter substrate-binding protein [Thermodesulfovibrionales bacterium]|nr:ABC transporter substrate-binding protein [Thermodesulfovibrionales bacterium]